VERYGMNDQEVLNCYAGPNRAILPPQWNSFPTQEVVTDPKIIHWAGPLKPWKRDYVLLREAWHDYQRRLRVREPAPIVTDPVAAGPPMPVPRKATPPPVVSETPPRGDDPPMHVRTAVALAWTKGRELDLSACDYGPGGAGRFRAGPTGYYHFLAGLAQVTRARAIVEIGTHFGGSARAFAEGQRAAGLAPHVLTYDVEDRAGTPILGFAGVERVLADVRYPEGGDRLAAWLGGEPIDLLYIDALKDNVFIETTLAALADQPVGWLVLDDIFATPSIRTAWNRLRRDFGDRAVTLDEVLRGVRSGGYGQGVVAPADLAATGMPAGALRDAAHRQWSSVAVVLRGGGRGSRDEAVHRQAVACCTGTGDVVVVGAAAKTARTLAEATGTRAALAGVSTDVIASFPSSGSRADPHYEQPVRRQEPSVEEFRRELGKAASTVNLFAGDVPSLRWAGRPIELLVASWSRDPTYLAYAWRELLPWCIPGGSLVLVEGIPDDALGSVEAELGRLRRHFEVLGTGRHRLALAPLGTADPETWRGLTDSAGATRWSRLGVPL
jgi:predicted O-methyltransferase YrrM